MNRAASPGMVLVTVLWTMALLSALAIATSVTFRSFNGIVSVARDRVEAQGLLTGGLEAAAAIVTRLKAILEDGRYPNVSFIFAAHQHLFYFHDKKNPWQTGPFDRQDPAGTTPARAEARMTDVPSGTVTGIPSISTVTWAGFTHYGR